MSKPPWVGAEHWPPPNQRTCPECGEIVCDLCIEGPCKGHSPTFLAANTFHQHERGQFWPAISAAQKKLIFHMSTGDDQLPWLDSLADSVGPGGWPTAEPAIRERLEVLNQLYWYSEQTA